MSVAAGTMFKWLDLLEREFDRSFVTVDLLLGTGFFIKLTFFDFSALWDFNPSRETSGQNVHFEVNRF